MNYLGTSLPNQIWMRGRAHLEAGRPARARRYLTRALALARAAPEPAVEYGALQDLADLQDEPGEALRYQLEAMEVHERQRERVLLPEHRAYAFRNSASGYVKAVEFAVAAMSRSHWPFEVGRAAMAFQLAELGRARVHAELLGMRAVVEAPEEEREAREAYDGALKRASAAPRDAEALARLREARTVLLRVRAQLRGRSEADERYVALREGEPADHRELRTLVTASGAGACVEYLVTADETYVLVLRGDGSEPEAHIVPIGRELLREHVEHAFFDSAGVKELPADWDLPLRPLVEPALRACRPGEPLWIVPHDVLHYVPMHAIGEPPLCARNPVQYSPSVSVMRGALAGPPRSHETARALVVADSSAERPIHHARMQASLIAGSVEADVVAGDGATTAVIAGRAADPTFGIVHIACHGRYDVDASTASGLLMADGTLTVEALSAAVIRAPLVVLSACESGLSEIRPAGELIGLPGSLMYAGVSTAVVSLWNVDGLSTAYLMTEFYHGVALGLPVARALQCAQLAVREATIEAVIARCEQARVSAGSEQRALIDLDIAALRLRAGDHREALRLCEEVSRTASASTFAGRTARRRAAHCRSAARHPVSLDYARKPFAAVHYWAGFILVGDGR